MSDRTPNTDPVRCSYCGRAIRRGTRPSWHKEGNGERLPYHRACWLERQYPDDPTVGHQRHDIH